MCRPAALIWQVMGSPDTPIAQQVPRVVYLVSIVSEPTGRHQTEEQWSAFKHDRPSIAADITHFIELIRRDVPLNADTSVLEVGCGWGITSFHLARQCKLQGVDTSTENLRLNPVRTVSLMDATRLGFADASFDVVLAHHVLHHIVDFNAALAEMARVSRRYVVVSDLNKWNPVNMGFVLLGAEELPNPYFSAKCLKVALERAGMKVVRSRTWGKLSPFLVPRALVPLQRMLWFEQPLGIEHIVIAEKI
ncbi:MAG: class I SAM-dependent methyltransferase [Dehalococcoidia bacterium]|nr:class I SAM-dependent methyltransferase [Dehalococcoidia bacterium]